MMKNQEMQEDEFFALKSPQRSQSLAIPATTYEPAQPSQRGTWMTRIGWIFTDRRASALSEQSEFGCTHFWEKYEGILFRKGPNDPIKNRFILSLLYHNPSALICVHPRLIFSRKTQEALAR